MVEHIGLFSWKGEPDAAMDHLGSESLGQPAPASKASRNMARNPFTQHPREVDETYAEHLATAAGFGATMVVGGLCVMIHAVLPFLFVNTGSKTMQKLHKRMTKRVDRVNWERHPII
jgi:hypothetical protein